MLSEFVSAQGIQTDLFGHVQTSPKSSALLDAMDRINKKMGKESIKLASEGFKWSFKMRQENKSQRYTTKLADLTRANCSFRFF